MRNVGRATPSGVSHGGDASDLDASPAEQHRQCTCVIRVATQICVEVNTHVARMPAAGSADSLASRDLGGAGLPSLPRKPMYGGAGPLVEVGRLLGRTPNGRQSEPSVDGKA